MLSRFRVIFAGTPEFAAQTLAAIHAAGFTVPLVLTQADRPAGRGMKLTSSAVKRYALAHDLPLSQPRSLRRTGKFPLDAATAIEQLRATPHDVMVVAAYGLLLPQEVLEIAPYGCINLHASLLPRWRGAAPIQRAIEAGDSETGVTLMQMDAGLDTGAVLSAVRVPIASTDTTGSLHLALAKAGAKLIVTGLCSLAREGHLPATPQPLSGVVYAEKISKQESYLDWRRDACVLARQIRAFDPSPGGAATLNGTVLKIWAADALGGVSDQVMPVLPGTILEVRPEGVTIACGRGALCATQWQKPGGKRLAAREFTAGFDLHPGQAFALPESI
jgi:methionyl-tRNA formyltransferase